MCYAVHASPIPGVATSLTATSDFEVPILGKLPEKSNCVSDGEDRLAFLQGLLRSHAISFHQRLVPLLLTTRRSYRGVPRP